MEPRPTHLDTTDPGKAGTADIGEDLDREIDGYPDRDGLVLLVPETRWAEFRRLTGAPADEETAVYRGVTVKRAAVTAVVAQEGF